MSDRSTDEPSPETSRRYDPETGNAAYEAGRQATSHRWTLIAVGAVSIVAGAVAILLPLAGTLTAAFVVGAALMASGIVGLFTAYRRNEGWHMAAAFALSILSVAVGAAMFLQPIAGILALTILVIAWFAASGILRIWYGARNMGEGGAWMIGVGVLSVAVAILLWFGLPFSATWILGVLLGIDLLLWGSLMIAFAVRIGRHGIGAASAA